MKIREKRENILTLLTKGMKGYEITNELGVDILTVSRYSVLSFLITQLSKRLD